MKAKKKWSEKHRTRRNLEKRVLSTVSYGKDI